MSGVNFHLEVRFILCRGFKSRHPNDIIDPTKKKKEKKRVVIHMPFEGKDAVRVIENGNMEKLTKVRKKEKKLSRKRPVSSCARMSSGESCAEL